MDLNNIITSVVTDQLTKGVSDKLGIPKDKSQSVVNMAIPLLVGGLAKNAKNPKEAKNITDAISNDHDGSILNDVSSLLNNEDKQIEGEKILGHILGNKASVASKAIGNQTNIKPEQAQQILSMIAPLVMGALATKQKKEGLDSSNISDFLQNSVNSNKNTPSKQNDILNQLLDQNNNGSVVDEIIQIGSKLLGGLFKKK